MKIFSSAFVIIGIIAASAMNLCAQEVDAVVTINDDQLSLASKQEVASFADDMQRYINNARWTGEEWEGPKVKMNINVVFTGGGNNAFSARLLVGSQRTLNKSEKLSPMMKLLDESWSFPYVRNQPFIQDPTRYDPMTGLIDFYVYVALGLDYDSYASQGGSAMYEKAWEIAQRAQVRNDVEGWSTQTPSGNYSRYGLIRELTEMRFAPIRKFIFDYHYNGLDLMNQNRAAALDSINSYFSALVIAKDRLVQPSVLLRMVSDAKYTEYSEIFTGYADPIIWRKLLYIDPGHQSAYEAAQNGSR
jgi:hypothetical protein